MEKNLHELCDMIADALAEATEKIRLAGGRMTTGDVNYLDKLTHTLKSIKTTLAMIEDAGSYKEYTKKSTEHAPAHYSYSRDSGVTDELRDLMDSAPDESVKEEFRRFIAKIESM